MTEKRELFEQRKQQKSKLARLESHVATVTMVGGACYCVLGPVARLLKLNLSPLSWNAV